MTLKQKIAQAVPSLTERRTRISMNGRKKTVEEIDYQVRPIRLADVLVAIEKRALIVSTHLFEVGSDTFVGFSCFAGEEKEARDMIWNLFDDDLDHQSKETIQFLESILL